MCTQLVLSTTTIGPAYKSAGKKRKTVVQQGKRVRKRIAREKLLFPSYIHRTKVNLCLWFKSVSQSLPKQSKNHRSLYDVLIIFSSCKQIGLCIPWPVEVKTTMETKQNQTQRNHAKSFVVQGMSRVWDFSDPVNWCVHKHICIFAQPGICTLCTARHGWSVFDLPPCARIIIRGLWHEKLWNNGCQLYNRCYSVNYCVHIVVDCSLIDTYPVEGLHATDPVFLGGLLWCIWTLGHHCQPVCENWAIRCTEINQQKNILGLYFQSFVSCTLLCNCTLQTARQGVFCAGL